MPEKRLGSFWVNAMFFTLLQRASLFIFGVVSYMIVVRGFSRETNGIWALYVSVFSIFESVKQGLLRNATIKFLGSNTYLPHRNAVLSSSLLIHLLFSLAVVLCIFLFGHFFAALLKAPELYPVLAWSALLVVLLIPFNHCEITLQARFRFPVLFTAAFIRQGIFFGGLIVLYFFFRPHFTLLNVLFLQIAGLVPALLFILLRSRGSFPTKFVADKRITGRLFSFGRYTFGTNLFAGLSRSFDHFVTSNTLGGDLGKSYVAYYHTVSRINNIADIPSLAAADVIYPKNVEVLEKEGMDKVKHYFEQVTGTILSVILPLSLFIFLFPRFVVGVIAGPGYYPAALILQLTILFSMVRPLSYQFGSTLDAIGKPRLNFRVNMLLMLANLALTWLFLKVYGGIGAAYATMVYYSLSFIVMQAILKIQVGINMRNILKAMISRYREVLGMIFRI